MLRTRIIPILLLQNESLVKTKNFSDPKYVGDPCNTVRIFNELEVDELAFLDISATREGRQPNFKLLADISNECFMPLAYGGGVNNFDDARRILSIGFEKISINSAAASHGELIQKLSEHFGSQAVVASIDVRRNVFGKPFVYTRSGKSKVSASPVEWAQEMERRGAGEILLTSIDREGTWGGFDIELIKSVASAVNIPVIAHGGAGSANDVALAVKEGGASAVAVGSMVVFQKKDMGVLVNFSESLREAI